MQSTRELNIELRNFPERRAVTGHPADSRPRTIGKNASIGAFTGDWHRITTQPPRAADRWSAALACARTAVAWRVGAGGVGLGAGTWWRRMDPPN